MLDRSDVRAGTADRIVAVSAVLSLIGAYIPWVNQADAFPDESLYPWELFGIFPSRAVIVVPFLCYAFVRFWSADSVRPYLLAMASTLLVLYPPYRLTQADFEWAKPDLGFYIVQIAGTLLLAAAIVTVYESD